ncbi:acetylglucosamine transferase [Rhodoferax antarcticus]|uniref:protein O-GlcNAc transferase n=1 Tax=Rhodoferax antarcticus ANT.BR TaxID=1111071 RepID=A0A1Q8YGJ9_9BURK|nr:acetylglucosamine transferase [Rhodoferax antarcticus]APW45630.1 acetylglucosamine transferase [Rhodoferax antarcticus]OLP07116.1 putative O-linked acetylglucosamine transferase [Rhodoferax antarcticus ANT.BR]
MTTNSKHTDQSNARLRAAHAAQDWKKVTLLCKQALRKDKRHLLANRFLGYALKMLRQFEPAIQAFQTGVVYCPADAELIANYTNLLLEQARSGEALPLLEKLCALRPTDSTSWAHVAQCCYALGLNEKGFGSAMVAYTMAKTNWEKTAALTQRAIHRRELGQIREAVEDCTAAIALWPTDPSNHTNRLLFMLADPQTAPEELTAAAREFGEIFEADHKPHWPSYSERQGDPWRKLKIGFLSPDFRVHAVMCFAEGILAQLDRRQFEVYAFYLHPSEDQVTKRVKCHVDYFIPLSGMGYEAQATCIRSHEIDILIDMTGHTGNNALLTMVRKPAPVQVTWLGFVATTGLTAIDYYLTDEVITPHGVDHLFIEALFRLPTYAGSYRALSRNPLWRYQPLYAVRKTPALSNGFITFGSCNNLGKLTDEVLALWGQLLQKMPTARLLIEGKGFGKADFAEGYRTRCASMGIDTGRLVLIPLDTAKQYLAYHDIDIALDPFPLTGGTTTCDVLWMGVPLVSMEGRSSPSRMSTDALTHLRRTEWLAKTPGEYLDIAIDLASNFLQLNEFRLAFRHEVEQSPLMRDDIVCQHFAAAMRTMWFRWQAKIEHPGDGIAQKNIVDIWEASRPAHLCTHPNRRVGLATGEKLTLEEVHQRLQKMVANALATSCAKVNSDGKDGMDQRWTAITELAELVLSAVPNDPVSLACLAEVEHAHGHTDFAVTYLEYAARAIRINEFQKT